MADPLTFTYSNTFELTYLMPHPSDPEVKVAVGPLVTGDRAVFAQAADIKAKNPEATHFTLVRKQLTLTITQLGDDPNPFEGHP